MSGILMAAVGNSYGSAPINTVAPVVSGTATVGQTLTTTNGTWTGAPAPTFTYQWKRTGSNIGGATSSTYVLVAADYANTIRCVVTATNSVAPSGVSANSNSTASVAGLAPVNTVAPVVSGSVTVGQTLSTTNGTWTGTPTPTFTYQWQRVTTNISGATSSTYVTVAADVGNTIRCVVTATNAISAVSANSNSTATIVAVRGCQSYTSPGSYTFTVPAGVTRISVVTVNGGGAANGGGNGGGLSYENNRTVTPGQTITVFIGTPATWAATNGPCSTISGFSATANNSGGTTGGKCGCYFGGGGGAAGYAGTGGSGGVGCCCSTYNGTAGSGGGAGGGGGGYATGKSGAGGGVGIFGQGSNGARGTSNGFCGTGGGGGSGGSAGGSAKPTTPPAGPGATGGAYGGGASAKNCPAGATGGVGAVRIVWPGNTRSFPSTCVS